MEIDEADSRNAYRASDVVPTAAGGVIRLSATEVSDPDLAYPTKPYNVAKKIFRGLCLLINQRDFNDSTGQSKRDGTDVDADRVERLFLTLGYFPSRYLNVNRQRFLQLLKEIATTDHSNFDSFVCVILTHGSNGVVFATDGPIPVETIVGHFRGDQCPTLVGKPKMFFFQACRGTNFDAGTAIPMVTDAADDVVVTKLPVESDILVAHSTVPGYFAWRNSSVGSWFIQELCRVLESDRQSKSPHDLLQLLTVVARCVAYQYRSNTGMAGSHNKTQMTSTTSTLTRLVYLTRSP